MATTPRSAISKLPFLPGYVAKDVKDKHNKSQTLAYGAGGSVDGAKPLVLAGLYAGQGKTPKLDLSALQTMTDPYHRYNMSTRSVAHDERDRMKESARNTYRPALQPAWLKHDRQVLKFDAYFQEPVHENPKETFRIRCCTIFFYLEDGTMMVSEPKVENSGIPQGAFIKRHRIPKPGQLGGGFYAFEDLAVGRTISLYSRSFRITGCDEFTRHFYEASLGASMAASEEPPLDAFKAAELPDPEEVVAERKDAVREIKEYSHISLGGNRRNTKLQQYLENDRKVLRFQCYWDDMSKYGVRKYYVLHYYLSDDSVEMLETHTRNAGVDPYPVFWKRSPLRKNPHVSPAPGMMEPPPIIYKPEDLSIGESINVLGREIVLYDCDDFTRTFYQSYMGLEQESIKIEAPQPKHVKLTYPPHNGFGSEEDSLGSCKHLTPRVPRKDIHKLLLNADKILRFEAVIVNGVFEDENRKFIVGLYQADDSVGVWELKQRNSGHAEGKFASKSKKKNPATGTWFKASDFYVGAIVEVNATPLHLVGADEAALHYMEEHPEEFHVADVGRVLSKLAGLRGHLSKQGGRIECAALQKDAATRFGIELVDHELITLARKFGKYEPGENIAYVDASAILTATS
eukprot:TRINITY_DN5513_c0_g1_i4.p1 TRINITY_DN5513_c0_g1~~TRINITY_DN5513_c0_g1_i4.p1  ORF type:complete len:629 (-),score=137.74 TRINITY_DN5513_c0_g1_i4:75-1961(-)